MAELPKSHFIMFSPWHHCCYLVNMVPDFLCVGCPRVYVCSMFPFVEKDVVNSLVTKQCETDTFSKICAFSFYNVLVSDAGNF